MQKYLISINDLPPQGKEFFLDDQEIWQVPLKEFKMDCRITQPIKCKIFVMSADDGCLVRGTLKGAVVVPCNRCTENANINLDSNFDEYEDIPKQSNEKIVDGHVVFDRGAPMLNLAEVAWEQFMLAMPSRPLCKSDCKGLCPQCGANLNLGSCECDTSNADPRMAPFRDVIIHKK